MVKAILDAIEAMVFTTEENEDTEKFNARGGSEDPGSGN